ncbi:DUF4430 domain-containing protein [Candidatus Gottesmanbacteria bacterium]|nr:DUF4430 domain-containing protein [Candidatus Gottesmanbacteria bacterium]
MSKIFKSPLIIAASLCFAIAIAIPFAVRDVEKSEVKAIKNKVIPTITLAPSPTQAEEKVQGQVYNAPTTAPTAMPKVANAQSNTVSPTVQPTSQPAIQTFQVSLLINGSAVGTVTLDQGANQCDVLTKAKDQGKISSLLMKYDSSLGTNGVYQINGQGKENSVWWVYKVNGQSPGQGCSLVKANNGDKIEWSYQGS